MAGLLALLLNLFALCAAALQLPNAVSSNMVLQREPLSPRLWGFANATAVVTVSMDGKQWTGVADAQGQWAIEMDPQKASTGKIITIADSFGLVTLTNIAFGDVFLCSGQSNMEFSTNDAFNASAEIADSINYPNLRLYTIADTAADSPQLDGKSKSNYRWGISGPSSFVPVNGAAFSYFSATCYFFGRDLYKSLGSIVPIGLVASDWGGQTVECFSSPDAMNDATCGDTQVSVAANKTMAKATRDNGNADGPVPNPSTSQLWYGQIYPFLNMRLTGAVWYQGEANAGDPTSYACRFPAMIADWRRKFQLPNLSFFFVQLAAFEADYSEIREAQMAALKLPKTGVAIAVDLGDPTSPQGSIHPRRKQEVGRRLSLACQKVQYSKQVSSEGPTLQSHAFEGDGVTLTFRSDTAQGLHVSGTAACTDCCKVSPLELLTKDNAWVRTGPLTIAGNRVTASIPAGGDSNATVVGVRYDWEGYPQCALYNGAGGPDDHVGLAGVPFKYSPPPPPPVSYQLVFRQTLPYLFQPNQYSLNVTFPSADNFAKLDKLESFRNQDTGKLDFKIRWPDLDGTETQHWKQTTNPYAQALKKLGGVQGYEAVGKIAHTDANWGGLEYDATGNALLDGSVGADTWFYAVGYFGANWGFGLAIPSFARPAKAVEVFAKDPKTDQFALIFRQTMPHIWPQGQGGQQVWSLNKQDPDNELYSILDELERFRGSDGKIEFKMNWPDRWNVWSQSSNPVTTKGVAQGYAAIDVQFTDNGWGGLEQNGGPSLFDGSDGIPTDWFYAIGLHADSGWTTIPAYGPGALQTELFVRVKTRESGEI